LTVRLQVEAFEPGALLAEFCRGRTTDGAVVSFTGLVRADQGAATKLEIEAYPGFTESEIDHIAAAAQARFSITDYLIVHRIGQIAPGEAVVFVATAAAHRREAFDAADHLMDYLKSRAPFWKKEHGAGQARWIEPTERDRTDAKRWDEQGSGQ
jgi:molybdopterin synthase catalytic subunit